MLVLALFVVSAAASLKWDLVNPVTTTDSWVTASVREDTIVAFTNNRLFTAAAASKKFVQVDITINSTADDLTWRDTCYFANASLFMAIGHYTSSAGQPTLMVANSADAKAWTISNQFTLQTNGPSIACGKNEVFLSTGVSVFQSIDGKKWTTKTPLATFSRMAYLPNLNYYVAWALEHEAVFTSSTREVWDFHVGPPKVPYTNIVQGKGVWVIAGNGVVYWSTNLAGWSVSDIPLNSGFTFAGLEFNAALNSFVITAHNYTGLYVFQSNNGQHWVQGCFFPSPMQVTTVVSAANLIYALGETGLVLFSEDAKNWDLLSGNFWTQVGLVSALPSGEWGAPAAARDSFQDSTLPFYTTKDGFTWTRSPTNASDVWLSFFEEPKRNTATGVYLATDKQYIYSSTDLKTWNKVFSAKMQNLQNLQSVYLDPTNSVWVLTASGPWVDELWTSVDDGNTWVRMMNCPTKLLRVFPLSASKFITIQLDFYGYWFFLTPDAGVTWKNTSIQVSSAEQAWLANSKVLLHVGSWNVTTSPLDDLTTWTTQPIKVGSSAKWLVFADTFYAINLFGATPQVWSSSDGVNWDLSDAPYYVRKLHSIATSATTLFGVADDGVSIVARQA